MALPVYLTVIPENIPEELKGLKCWVTWKPEVEKGKSKPGKVPYFLQINKATGEKEVKHASVNNPETWMTFEDAMDLYKSSKKYKGISIALSSEIMKEELPRLIGIDLDNCILPDGSIDPEKLEEIKLFNTYTELSPSGEGLRAFCYGCFPAGEGVHADNNEIYQYRKFLSVTGHKLNDVPATVEYAQEAITAFRAKYFKHFSEIDEANLPVTSVKLSDEEILSNLETYKLSEKFRKLYYNGAAEGDDHSQKDIDLCYLIVFWTQDKEQIDRIFRQSKLYRDKWDEMHGHDDKGPLTYGQMTINYALKTRKDVYSPRSTNAPLNQSEFSFTMHPFSVSEDGIYKVIYKNGLDEELGTSKVQISNTPCIITAIGENIDNGEILYKVKIKDIKHREKTLWKKTSDLMKKADVVKLLNEGMHFKEAKANDIIDYFDKYINLHKENLPSEFAASAGGWKRNFSLFVVGDKAILADEVKGILQIDNPTASFFAQKGSIEEWAKAANIILFYPAVRFKAYTAFVPTMIRILDCTTYILDNNVSTGKLKTVSNWLAASMWGDPVKLQAGANSTQVGIMKLVEYCTDIPTFVDETSQAPEHIKKLIYWVANGNSRLKGTSDGGLVIPPSHATVIIATGEDPIVPENAHGGEDVRVLPLREGVSDILPTDIVNEMEIGIKNNYGHIAVRFIQELLKEKNDLSDIYRAYFRKFPEVQDITSNRAKKNYAITATAGYLLEKVFEEIGIDPMNPYEICSRYFEQNVLDDSFTPDYIKVLNATYSFFTTNEVHFGKDDEDSEEGEIETNNEKYGWIRGEDNELICFNENALKKHITATLGPHRYESAVKVWKDLKILNSREVKDKETSRIKVLKTVQIRVHGRKITVLQIPLQNFYKYLNLDEHNQSIESENKLNNSLKQADIETSSVGATVVTSLCDSVKITDTTNNDDLVELDNDAELAEILRQEGF